MIDLLRDVSPPNEYTPPAPTFEVAPPAFVHDPDFQRFVSAIADILADQ